MEFESKSPDFQVPDDGGDRYYANLIRSIIYGLLGLSFVFIIVSSVFFRVLIARSILITGVIILASIIVFQLLPRGFIRQAGAFLVGMIWISSSYLAFTGGGLGAPIIASNFILIIIASILLGPRGGIWVAFASIVFGVFLAVIEIDRGTLTLVNYSPFARLAIYIFFLVLAVTLQNISVKVAESAVVRAHANEMQYRLFLESIPIVTYINDLSLESRTIYVSPQVTSLLGYNQNEFLQDPLFWRKILHPEDYTRVFYENERTSSTGENFLMDYRLMRKNGGVIWVRDEALVVRNEINEPLYWLGVWTDITQRKQSEQSLEQVVHTLTTRTTQLMAASEISNATSSLLDLSELLPNVVELICSHFDYYYVGIFLLDDEGKYAILRAGTGEAGKRMIAENHSLRVGGASMIGWCVANNKARIALDVGKETVRFNNPYLPNSRSELALPLRARGQVIGAMSIQSVVESAFSDADITALQTMADQAANAIETARLFDERSILIDELGAKNSELERFTYTVSHDLKSPLVTIKGYLGYIKKDLKSRNFTRFENDLDRIGQATDTMQTLLNDLIDLSRVGRVVHSPEDVPMEELVDEAYGASVSPVSMTNLEFIVKPNLPIIHCDRVRVVEVLQNLFSNSVKFMGDQRHPIIEVGVTEIKDNFAVLYVKDNGIGIDKQFHEQVFGLFNRLNPDVEGTGIGLALIKRIIEFHYGKIWLESEGKGMGTTVFFTLPISEMGTLN